jgi:hypothetical protein
MISKDDVIALLQSDEVQDIEFEAEAVKIDGDVYSALIPKLNNGHLRVVANRAVTNNPSGFFAWYNPGSNQFVVSPTNNLQTDNELANGVHEMTHAAIDNMNLPRSRGLSRTESEAIAYIAQQVFWHNSNFAVPHHWSHRLFDVADKIAQNIIASTKLYVVTQDEIRILRNTIAHDRAYRINPTTGQPMTIRGQQAASDGIP